MFDIEFMVCTICNTYNHETYILDALNGFVLQRTSFPTVTVIEDDASTDNTPCIITHFINKNFDFCCDYPGIIDTDETSLIIARHKTNPFCYFVYVKLKSNHYQQKKDMDCYLDPWRKNAKYIAYCEGDDYWTDPYKLQKQVDFLESNKGFIACFHNTLVRSMDGIRLFNPLNETSIHEAPDLIRRKWFIATPSLLFRNQHSPFPEWKKEMINEDYLIELMLAREGKFFYMNDIMAVYRQHGQGLSALLNHNKVDMFERLISLLNRVRPYYGDEYASYFDEAVTHYSLLKEECVREEYYERHLLLRLLRPKTYKRIIKRWLKRLHNDSFHNNY